ncbi:MAG: sialidase family protein [Chloroflexota bacterium]
MTENQILDIGRLVGNGQLFRPDLDRDRIEAYLPPMGRENHGSNLMELPNGDLLCVWFGGDREGAQNVSIALSRLSPHAGRWTDPVYVSDDPNRSDQNPVLFVAPDGKLWLLYASQESRGQAPGSWDEKFSKGEVQGIHWMQWTSVIRRRVSADNGHTWGPMETIFDRPGSFCRNPMVILSNGDWLFPMYYSRREGEGVYGNDTSVMQISADEGQTWTEYPVPGSRGRVHPTVIELSAGRLVSFFRSRSADRIYVSHSNDFGRTWTEPGRTELPNNNASIQAIKLASGHIALAFNHLSLNDDPAKTLWPPDRYPLTLALSADEGQTWPYMRHLDTGDGFYGQENKKYNRCLAYPAILQTRDGRIHISYSFRGRQCIKYVCLQEEWIRDHRSRLFDEIR